MHDMISNGAMCALSQKEVIPAKEENNRESIPDVSRFRAEEPEGQSCEFDMLGVCGGRTGCLSGFVSSF